ncbi:MAG: hypothetical protein ACFB0D_08970 [Phormidesmis sp.]
MGDYSEPIQFVFLGDVISANDIVLSDDEICECRFVEIEMVLELLGVYGQRLQSCLRS